MLDWIKGKKKEEQPPPKKDSPPKVETPVEGSGGLGGLGNDLFMGMSLKKQPVLQSTQNVGPTTATALTNRLPPIPSTGGFHFVNNPMNPPLPRTAEPKTPEYPQEHIPDIPGSIQNTGDTGFTLLEKPAVNREEENIDNIENIGNTAGNIEINPTNIEINTTNIEINPTNMGSIWGDLGKTVEKVSHHRKAPIMQGEVFAAMPPDLSALIGANIHNMPAHMPTDATHITTTNIILPPEIIPHPNMSSGNPSGESNQIIQTIHSEDAGGSGVGGFNFASKTPTTKTPPTTATPPTESEVLKATGEILSIDAPTHIPTFIPKAQNSPPSEKLSQKIFKALKSDHVSGISLIEEEFNKYSLKEVDLLIEEHNQSANAIQIKEDLEELKVEKEAVKIKLREVEEKENYQEAEKFNNQISKYKDIIKKKKDHYKQVNDNVKVLERKRNDQIKNKTTLMHDVNEDLTQYLSEKEGRLKGFEGEEKNKIEDKLELLGQEKEKLDSLVGGLDHNKIDYEEKDNDLNETIYTVTEDFVKEKNVHLEAIAEINDDIAKLEVKIEEKKREKVALELLTKGLDSNIDDVKKVYRDKIDEVNTAKVKYDENKAEYEEANTNYAKIEKELKDYEVKVLDTISELKSVISKTFLLVTDFSTQSDNLQTKLNNKNKYENLEQKQRKKLHDLQLKIKNTERKKEFYHSKLVKFEVEEEELTATITNKNNEIKVLEQKKKGFVATRDYKNASKTANGIKGLQEDIQLKEKMKENNINQKSTQETEIKKTQLDILRMVEDEKAVRTEFEETRHHILKIRKNEITDILKFLEGVEYSSYGVAIIQEELEHVEGEINTIVEQYNLQSEDFEELRTEQLKEKYTKLKAETMELDSKIQEAVEEENFERADEIDQKYQQLLKQLNNIEEILNLKGIPLETQDNKEMEAEVGDSERKSSQIEEDEGERKEEIQEVETVIEEGEATIQVRKDEEGNEGIDEIKEVSEINEVNEEVKEIKEVINVNEIKRQESTEKEARESHEEKSILEGIEEEKKENIEEEQKEPIAEQLNDENTEISRDKDSNSTTKEEETEDIKDKPRGILANPLNPNSNVEPIPN